MKRISDDVSLRAASYKFLSDCYYLPDSSYLERVADAAQINILFVELASLILPSKVRFSLMSFNVLYFELK